MWVIVAYLLSARQVKVGVCQGMISTFRQNRSFTVRWIEAAFPDRQVQEITLDHRCEGPREAEVDVVVVIWNNYNTLWQEKISKPRRFPLAHNITPTPADTQNDLIFYPKGSVIVPHRPGRPFVIATNEEDTGGVNEIYDVVIQTTVVPYASRGANLYWPLASRAFYDMGFQQRFIPSNLLDVASYDAWRNRHFLAFMSSYCDDTANMHGLGGTEGGPYIRVALFDNLRAHCGDSVHGIGNHPNFKKCGRKTHNMAIGSRTHFYDEIVDTYRQYKFVLAFENSFCKGWWTEKMISAVLAGAIPIYGGWGPSPDIAEHVDPARFIYCNFEKNRSTSLGLCSSQDEERRIRLFKHLQKENLNSCIRKIKAVANDPKAIRRILNTPLIKGGRVSNTIFDLKRIGQNLRQILQDHDSYLI